MTVFFDLIKDVKHEKKANSKELITTMVDIKKDLIIFANEDVLNKYFIWLINSDTKASFVTMADLLIAIRKDMGNPKTTITREQCLKGLIQGEDAIDELRKIGYFSTEIKPW